MKNNYFSYDIAMQYLANSEALLIKLIKSFLNNYEGFIDTLDSDVYDKIHCLKGITLNLGAEALFTECQTILEAIKKGEDYDIDSFKECFSTTYIALNSFINKN